MAFDIVRAVATSPTKVVVTFGQTVLNDVASRDPGSYTWDLTTVTVAVLGVSGPQVTLEVSALGANIVYTLSVDAGVRSSLGEALAVPTTPVLGFIAPEGAVDQQPIKAYNLIPRVIREADQNEGGQFLERFLSGYQTIFELSTRMANSLVDMYNLDKLADALVAYLGRITGWDKRLETQIPERLDTAKKRILFSESYLIWRQRSSDDAIEDFLALVTGARCAVKTWFDLRIIEGESYIGEDGEGTDTWLLDPDGVDPYEFNVRIVDDGSLDRELTYYAVRLMRPSGERVLITYLDFLDTFSDEDDNSQWTEEAGTLNVSSGSGVLSSGGVAAIADFSDDEVALGVKLKQSAGTFAVQFLRTDASNHYSLELDFAANTIKFRKTVAGSPTTLGTYSPVEALVADTTYVVRAYAYELPTGGHRLSCFFDAERVLTVDDSTYTAGGVALASSSGSTTLDWFELLKTPTEFAYLDINS